MGGVAFVGCWDGANHMHVTVRGHGPEGSRPLLGVLTMSEDEWAAFEREAARPAHSNPFGSCPACALDSTVGDHNLALILQGDGGVGPPEVGDEF